jgi:hypothetical protein
MGMTAASAQNSISQLPNGPSAKNGAGKSIEGIEEPGSARRGGGEKTTLIVGAAAVN